jgi:magnesium-dependent phosphatase 1
LFLLAVHVTPSGKSHLFEWQVSNMGVTSILVEDGIRLGALREGLKEFSEKIVMHLRKTTKGGSNYHKIQIHL